VEVLVVQASYRSALTDRATVVLPATIWSERSGTIYNLECRPLKLAAAVPAGAAARDDRVILETVWGGAG